MIEGKKGLPAVLFTAACLIVPSALSQPADIWAGVYSEQQAMRGADTYLARCSSCHAANLRGNSLSPSLVGLSFMFIWENQTLGDLFTKIRTTMPSERPGSLTNQATADLIAYILQVNEFPSGDVELLADAKALAAYKITPGHD